MENFILYDNYGISTVKDGYSKGSYKYNNMSFNTKEDKSIIIKNREKLAKCIGYTLNDFVIGEQTHSSNFYKVEISDKGCGAYDIESAIKNNDALYTFESNIVLATYHADCVPIFFTSKKHKLIGIIHAGWGGTSKHITYNTLNHIISTYNINPEDIKVHIGPSISQENYEVGKDVLEKLGSYKEAFINSHNSAYADIALINKLQVMSLGITNIDHDDRCTYKHSDLFYSHRRDNNTGRMLAFIFQRS